MQLLGQILLEKGYINEAELECALTLAHKSKSRLGEVLVATGVISYLPLYQAVAEHYKLDFVNLLELEPDVRLLSEKHVGDYLRLRALPYLRHNNIVTIATADLSEELISWAKAQFGDNLQFAITSPFDIRTIVQKYFASVITHQSQYALMEASPELSAQTPASPRTKKIGMTSLAALALGIWLFPAWVLIIATALCYALYGLSLFFKVIAYAVGIAASKQDDYGAPISDADLPCYTVLVPMYRETESVANIMVAMQRMDYPPAKLDIKLVLEEDDMETITAAKLLKPRYQFEIVIVPPSLPRTKPKACNYALRFARGEYITIYDADDRPAPDQLKKAVHVLRHSPPDVICLQARLNYYNAYDNWLTRWFSLEYAMLFNVMLYGLSRMRIPVLLGGTSNHIALEKLKSLGEWDPFNVTEDADLGARLAARGYRTIMLDSSTLEEAPNTLKSWLNQRARWVKGYMQTWLVHMRTPGKLMKSYKIHGFIGFQCFVALASFAYLTAPIVWTLALIWLLTDIALFPDWLYMVASMNLVANFAVHILSSLHAASLYQSRRAGLMAAAITYPFYLILHTIASYMALFQLWLKPHLWNKTTHGRAKTFDEAIL